MIMEKKKIILASASPRRRELLEQAGLVYEVMPSSVEERVAFEDPGLVVEDLAAKKAEDVAKNVEDGIVIGADTVVALDGEILGKPKDDEDAFRMLSAMQGKAHTVYTGVSIVVKEEKEKKEVKIFSVATKVFMYPLEEKEIRAYIATKEPSDKAGAYAIQGKAAVFVEKIEGDYNNVVGLPLSRVYREIRKYL